MILWPSRSAHPSSSLSVSLQYLCQWHTPDKILQMSSFVIYLNPLIRPWLCSLPKQEQDLRWHTSFFRNNGSHVRGLVWLEINDGSSVGPKGEKCYQITTNKGVVSLVHIVRRKKIQIVKPKWGVEKKCCCWFGRTKCPAQKVLVSAFQNHSWLIHKPCD